MDKEKVRNWWLALADQYEEWADEPPVNCWDGKEVYTCEALNDGDSPWGFARVSAFGQSLYPSDALVAVWAQIYGPTAYPAGHVTEAGRVAKREEFCLDMAELIRENVQ